jgi:hypothetical protein
VNPPYTTQSGLRVGSRYVAGVCVPHDADATRLQSALIAHPKPLLRLCEAKAALAALRCALKQLRKNLSLNLKRERYENRD